MSMQLLIIIIYFAVTLVIGTLTRENTNSPAAYHGKNLGLFSIICIACGEWLGGTATTGVAEYGFLYGLSGAWYTIANAIGVFILGIFFAEFFRSIAKSTVPSIIDHFFGVGARITSSVILIVVMLAVGISQMIAAGKLGQSLLGISFPVSCVIFATIFILYTLAGGMNAVASTNKLHLGVMYGGVLIGVFLAVQKAGGLSGMTASLAASDAVSGTSHFSMTAIGIPKISSWIIASILGAETAQAGLQPVLSAQDAPSARKACLISAVLIAPFGIMTTLIGMAAKVLSDQGALTGKAGVNVTDAKLAFSTLMTLLPAPAGGLILAAILAAILSTISPIILAAATLFTRDIFQTVIRPGIKGAPVLKASRTATAVSGIICCVFAILLEKATTVLDLVYSAYSLRGALFIVILYGIYAKKAEPAAVIPSMIITSAGTVIWKVLQAARGSYPMIAGFAVTETYAAVIIMAVSIFVLSSFSSGKKHRA